MIGLFGERVLSVGEELLIRETKRTPPTLPPRQDSPRRGSGSREGPPEKRTTPPGRPVWCVTDETPDRRDLTLYPLGDPPGGEEGVPETIRFPDRSLEETLVSRREDQSLLSFPPYAPKSGPPARTRRGHRDAGTSWVGTSTRNRSHTRTSRRGRRRRGSDRGR